MEDHRREALLKEYGEVSNNFRLLTDIRFKLLAFLPIAAAAAAAVNGNRAGTASFALSLFGLAATIGLVTYNSRNDQLYDELVGRAASIERSLGLADGAFANRPQPWLSLHMLALNWRVDHRTGIATIYAASIALWLFGLFVPLLELGRHVYMALGLPTFVVVDPVVWIQGMAVALAVLTIRRAAKSIKNQIKQRRTQMQDQAARAVKRAKAVDLQAVAHDQELVELCAKLSGLRPEVIQARARFLPTVAPESLRHYLPHGSEDQTASHLVALLTDLPPRWLLDCATNRRGTAATC